MRIKALTTNDFINNKSTILELLVETYMLNFDISKAKSEVICKGKIEELLEYLNQNHVILIGAYQEELLVGFLWSYKHEFFGEKRLHINQIVVQTDYRGKKVGSKLMEAVEEVAKEQKINTIDLFVSEDNLKAINMYDSIGYMTERRYMKKNIQER